MRHWYPTTSTDFHENSMTGMMVLRKGYALVFGPSDVKKPCQVRGPSRDYVAEKGMPTKLGSCMTMWKGVTGFLEGLCRIEGKVEDGFVLVISISIWNHMHIRCVP